MIRPCPNVSDCPGTDDPSTNYSSEQPDGLDYIAMFWRGSPFPGGKPLERPWTLNACGTIITGTDTQIEAELEAIIAAINCDFHDSYDPDIPGVPNTDQICCQQIPGGGTRCYTIKAGKLVALNQASADEIAHALACYQTSRSLMGLSDIDTKVCLGKFYGEFITANGAFAPVHFTVAGSPPPGLEFHDLGDGSFVVQGMPAPTSAGNYSFLLTAQDALGTQVKKVYTLNVFGISNLSSMTAPILSQTYLFQLTGAGGTAPYAFSITSGSLPTGLTMSDTGQISGTPTATGPSLFTVQVTDSSGLSCSYPTSLTVTAVGYQVCNWTTIRATLNTGSWPASAFPAAPWDGTFSLHTVAPSGATYYYFLSKSINGKATAANETPDYPVGAWADNDSYTQLSYVPGIGTWFVAFAPAGLGADPNSYVYQGPANFNSDDASGVYDLIYSVAGTPPAKIVVQSLVSLCCPDSTENLSTPVPATWAAAQPARVRVRNYSQVLAAFGSCAVCSAATTHPAWDGNLPVKYAPNAFELHYWPAGTPVVFPFNQPALSIAGRIVNTGFTNTRLQVVFSPGTAWTLRIQCEGFGGDGIWVGEKTYGLDPVGTYTRLASSQAAAGPDCIHIESY